MTESEFFTTYGNKLNKKQAEAVKTINGPVLLLAVSGSGKTTVLVTRLGFMIHCAGILPEHILTLTYTVAATADMAERFSAIFGKEDADRLEFRTINGICAKIIAHYGKLIGKEPFALVTDDKWTGKLISDSYVKHVREYPTESDIKALRSLITYSKNMLLSDEEIEELGKKEGLPLFPILKEYQENLRAQGWMDYDDQLIYAYRMLNRAPQLLDHYRKKYAYICVDEAQDTSKIQHLLIGLLAGKDGNLFMVGDEDQSIYGFRAAYPEALLSFAEVHPGAKILVMDQNYRCDGKIVAAADAFIQHNKFRYPKKMKAIRDRHASLSYIKLKKRNDQYEYLANVAADLQQQTAVLYRDNESVLPLIDLLERRKIPYRTRNLDMTFFSHRVVMDILGIIRFAFDPADTETFLSIYYKCQTYLKRQQAESMCRIAVREGMDVLDAAEEMDSLSGVVRGKCRALRTHLKHMLKESPSRALYRIENFIGYGEYMDRGGLDENKLYILQQIAEGEATLGGFLSRLETLQKMLKSSGGDEQAELILSTIHSSKGLEYDEVYLMDVCDGVFPDSLIKPVTIREQKELEEERRLFYVGMTRARNHLHIFRYKNLSSMFIHELCENL